jgi:hypothetical protein
MDNKHGDNINVGGKAAHASVTDGINEPQLSARSLLKSESISASKCIGEKQNQCKYRKQTSLITFEVSKKLLN